MRFFVVAGGLRVRTISCSLDIVLHSLVSDVGDRYKQLEGALLICFPNASLDLILDLLLPLFSVACESKILFVAPQNIRSS